MAPFLINPLSTFIVPTKRKITHTHHTTKSSSSKLSKTAIIVIIVVVAVLILAIAAFFVIQKRRKAKGGGGNSNKRSTMGVLMRGNTFPGYSADASGGLYGGTPGAYAGGAPLDAEGKHSMTGYNSSDYEGVGGDHGRASIGGFSYRGVETTGHGRGGGEAAGYHAQGSYGRHSQDVPQQGGYGPVGSFPVPERPPLAFYPSPARI